MRGHLFGAAVTAAAAVSLAAATTAWAAPETSIDSGPPTYTNSPQANFTFSGTGAVSFECKLDSGGSYASCTSPHQETGVPEGSHTFYVRAKDGAGTPDPSPATWNWTVDFTPPDTNLTS